MLTGQRFENVDRRGKYLLLELDSGDELMVHLGMTGHLLVCDADAPVAKHTHIRASLDDGNELRFDDARRFGRVAYGSREALIGCAGAAEARASNRFPTRSRRSGSTRCCARRRGP